MKNSMVLKKICSMPSQTNVSVASDSDIENGTEMQEEDTPRNYRREMYRDVKNEVGKIYDPSNYGIDEFSDYSSSDRDGFSDSDTNDWSDDPRMGG